MRVCGLNEQWLPPTHLYAASILGAKITPRASYLGGWEMAAEASHAFLARPCALWDNHSTLWGVRDFCG